MCMRFGGNHRAQADGVRCNKTMEQQRLSIFIEEQQRRLQTAKRRAAESRAGAARLATIARDAGARRQLCEKKSICNKVCTCVCVKEHKENTHVCVFGKRMGKGLAP